MVVKMMKWSPWPPVSNSKKFQVKVKPLKLQWCNFNGGFEEREDQKMVVVVEMKWKGPKAAGLAALGRSTNSGKNVSAQRIIQNGLDIEFDDELEAVCNLSIFQKDNSFTPFDVSFNLLYGQSGELKNKLAVIGSVSFNIADLASQMESEIEKKLPITLQVAGVASEATLLISVSFVEMRTDLVGIVQETTEPDKEEGFFRKVKDLTGISKSKKKKKKKKIEGKEMGDERDTNRFSGDTDESTTFDSDGSPDNNLGPIQPDSEGVVAAKEDETSIYYSNDTEKEASLVTQMGPSTSSEARLESVDKVGFWKKRKLSFRSGKKKEEPFIETTKSDVDQRLIGSSSDDCVTSKEKTKDRLTTNSSPNSNSNAQELSIGDWEERELISRDNQTKLITNVFFASMDQRSEKAAGESACTALVAVIADWLQSNPNKTPTLSEFDDLITEGSSEWRKLCDNETYIQNFPDKHFDLETVLEAKIRPLHVRSDKSFIGFFCPESFESLKGAMSFDGIWEEIRNTIEENDEPRVFIVSWNDHFFVLKVEGDAYYLIDTLGERLFEGCNQAYILKFDDSSTMNSLSKKAEMEKEEKQDTNGDEEDQISICSGKECCREFIKRFLAAIPLRELEIEEKKGTLSSVVPLHQRLQIEFHFSSSSSSSS